MADVELYGMSASTFSHRIEIALKIKGVAYEYVEEDLQNKSQNLLQYNPIYEKVPVLIHEGKPLLESLIILKYIDETWKDPPLLSNDPYNRSRVRFWANFINQTVCVICISCHIGTTNQ
ncbi:hypothetical protein QJS04_geneDACA013421 [Acorus gramineus]|uniref:Glutathione S-transferase n=1 Tax=Acorus gramineus TaxID=55184 RepID=A0AAV9AA50_ACOGR|nr:hypothetical protein QJS04_geneDACA013421 [Acorus gramineus]